MWLEMILVIGLCVVTIAVLVWYSRRGSDRYKKIPAPDERGGAWSNNAIRKQGKAGKGIR